MSMDLVAVWEVALSDGVHKVEFEHGTTSGKRVIVVDGKELMRNDWMFKLVGREHFTIGKAKCTISIEAISGFAYEYSMEVNGKSLQKFAENQSKIMKSWTCILHNEPIRVTLEKDTLDIWVNGRKVDAAGEFTEQGTETHFTIMNCDAFIRAASERTGVRKNKIIHRLFVNDSEIPEAKE